MTSVLGGRNVWLAAAASAGALVIGYCIYFDAKRRGDPNFKKTLREKRKRLRQEKSAEITGPGVIPDLRDQEAVQRFFLGAVQKGEDLLANGDVDGAVQSLGAAIAVCGHPQQLLHILQQTLPPQVFHLLLTRLPMIGQAVHARQEASYGVSVRGSLGEGGAMMGGMPMGAGGGLGPSGIREISLDDELE